MCRKQAHDRFNGNKQLLSKSRERPLHVNRIKKTDWTGPTYCVRTAGDRLRAPSTPRHPARSSVCSGCRRECVARGMSVFVWNRKDRHDGSLAERKNPRIHFSALSALWKAECVRLLWEGTAALPARWGVAYDGALRLADDGPCDLLCGLMEEVRPRGHSLSPSVRACLIRHCLVQNYRLFVCVWGSYLYLSLSLLHVCAHSRSLYIHTHTKGDPGSRPVGIELPWVSRIHVPGLPFSSRFYSLPHESSRLAIFSRMNTHTLQ